MWLKIRKLQHEGMSMQKIWTYVYWYYQDLHGPTETLSIDIIQVELSLSRLKHDFFGKQSWIKLRNSNSFRLIKKIILGVKESSIFLFSGLSSKRSPVKNRTFCVLYISSARLIKILKAHDNKSAEIGFSTIQINDQTLISCYHKFSVLTKSSQHRQTVILLLKCKLIQ